LQDLLALAGLEPLELPQEHLGQVELGRLDVRSERKRSAARVGVSPVGACLGATAAGAPANPIFR